ncbi:MAG: Stearoyl-CoA 9-desaturase [Fibrobacteres bacterium]|nr:Stearoyl-CoA 9-desaturase [Fibrobacterota bacterium]
MCTMPSITGPGTKNFFTGIVQWFDNEAPQGITFGPEDRKVSHLRLLPFWILHLPVLAVLWVGVSPVAVAVAASLYFIRMFAITGWYHRYFSHRTFKTGRVMQFLFAYIGNASAQRGALHWAAHHRNHHRFSDQPEDPHSPRQHGFWISHMLWFGKKENATAQSRHCKDFAKYPELMFLDRFDFVAPISLGALTLVLGWVLHRVAPQLHTTAGQMLIWGFFVSTIALYHGTFSINSLGHIMGRQRYATGDDSKNSFLLALITLGEGWHNNHHHYANTVRQGFRWWEIDVSFYLLWGFSKLGLVWDLKPVPRHLLETGPAQADWTAVPAHAETPAAALNTPAPDEPHFSKAA